jgi:hypothetical protein
VKIEGRFPTQVGMTLVVMIALAAYPLARYAPGEVRLAAGAGALIAMLNVLAGYAAIEYAIHRSHTTFLMVVLGGMGVRLLLMLGALVWLILGVGMHAIALTVSLLVCYLVFLVIEVLFIQKRILTKNEN